MSEQDPLSAKDASTRATIDRLTDRLATITLNERQEALEAGLDLMLADFNENPDYFRQQQARADRDPVRVAEREKSEDLYRIRRSLGYGALGYAVKPPEAPQDPAAILDISHVPRDLIANSRETWL